MTFKNTLRSKHAQVTLEFDLSSGAVILRIDNS